tara:strand:+ start:555 stop:758 length:204 start_codon:yes stop_codon:yes gene_type:complete
VTNRQAIINAVIESQEEKWVKVTGIYNDFWQARTAFWNHLMSEKLLLKEDFHLFKMVLGEREAKKDK